MWRCVSMGLTKTWLIIFLLNDIKNIYISSSRGIGFWLNHRVVHFQLSFPLICWRQTAADLSWFGLVVGKLNFNTTVNGWNPANHLACMKLYKKWDKLPISTGGCRISAINSMKEFHGNLGDLGDLPLMILQPIKPPIGATPPPMNLCHILDLATSSSGLKKKEQKNLSVKQKSQENKNTRNAALISKGLWIVYCFRVVNSIFIYFHI